MYACGRLVWGFSFLNAWERYEMTVCWIEDDVKAMRKVEGDSEYEVIRDTATTLIRKRKNHHVNRSQVGDGKKRKKCKVASNLQNGIPLILNTNRTLFVNGLAVLHQHHHPTITHFLLTVISKQHNGRHLLSLLHASFPSSTQARKKRI
jgi:hypothetical protein